MRLPLITETPGVGLRKRENHAYLQDHRLRSHMCGTDYMTAGTINTIYMRELTGPMTVFLPVPEWERFVCRFEFVSRRQQYRLELLPHAISAFIAA